MDDLLTQVRDVIMPALISENVELVDLQLKGPAGNRNLKIFIDATDGVTLETCTRISRVVSDELDIADLIRGKYRLEVSSPGLNRPLRSAVDFRRNLKKEAEIVCVEDSTEKRYRGTILHVSEELVEISGKDGPKRILFSSIKQGKLSLPW